MTFIYFNIIAMFNNFNIVSFRKRKKEKKKKGDSNKDNFLARDEEANVILIHTFCHLDYTTLNYTHKINKIKCRSFIKLQAICLIFFFKWKKDTSTSSHNLINNPINQCTRIHPVLSRNFWRKGKKL